MVSRLHIRPDGIPPQKAVAYCLENGVIGLGWGIDALERHETRAEYLARHAEYWGKGIGPVRRLLSLQKDQLVWFRDEKGSYLLACVIGEPEPCFSAAARDVDMCHICSSEIVAMHSDNDVPGIVKASFARRGSAFEGIGDDTGYLDVYSKYIFNLRVDRAHFDVTLPQADLFTLLDPYELEDLVLLYLQSEGWFMVPSSHVRNTPRYEATLMNEHSPVPGGVQVKGKRTSLPAADYAGDGRQVFLFAANGIYGDYIPENVTIIQAEDLRKFAKEHPNLLPEPVRLWSRLAAS